MDIRERWIYPEIHEWWKRFEWKPDGEASALGIALPHLQHAVEVLKTSLPDSWIEKQNKLPILSRHPLASALHRINDLGALCAIYFAGLIETLARTNDSGSKLKMLLNTKSCECVVAEIAIYRILDECGLDPTFIPEQRGGNKTPDILAGGEHGFHVEVTSLFTSDRESAYRGFETLICRRLRHGRYEFDMHVVPDTEFVRRLMRLRDSGTRWRAMCLRALDFEKEWEDRIEEVFNADLSPTSQRAIHLPGFATITLKPAFPDDIGYITVETPSDRLDSSRISRVVASKAGRFGQLRSPGSVLVIRIDRASDVSLKAATDSVRSCIVDYPHVSAVLMLSIVESRECITESTVSVLNEGATRSAAELGWETLLRSTRRKIIPT